jgi:hypothetical protein
MQNIHNKLFLDLASFEILPACHRYATGAAYISTCHCMNGGYVCAGLFFPTPSKASKDNQS